MLSKKIPKTGEAIPVIGLGTWQTFDVGTLSERTALHPVLRSFADAGCTLLDTSPMYGRAESVCGELTETLELRSKLFLATKVWISGKSAGIAQMESSFRKMRTEQMDLMQVHNLLDVNAHLETLAEWKAAGRVRYVGITHYTASAHASVTKLLETRELDFVQINYSVVEREAEDRLLETARDRGVAVIANRPFATGELFSRLKKRALPAWAAELDCDSWAQLLLKFVVSHPAVTCAIPATSSADHLADDLKAGEGRLPDAKQREQIAEAAR